MTTKTKASNATAGRSGKIAKTNQATTTPVANRKLAKEPAAKGRLLKLPAAPAETLTEAAPALTKGPSRLATIVQHLQASSGASIAELCTATGWQAHSICGAMAGALKRKGHVITSSVIEGVRRYQITATP